MEHNNENKSQGTAMRYELRFANAVTPQGMIGL